MRAPRRQRTRRRSSDHAGVQPKTLAQRVAIANDFSRRFKFPLPLAVDDISNGAEQAFAAWPERLYIIGEDGKVAYKGGLGPFDYKPEEVRAWLEAKFPAPVATR
ncbi:MAG: deiodinase-like protein [Candidatus Acidiferrales bacterium]